MNQHLSVRDRWRIITLRFDGGLSFRTIARIIPCSFSAVRKIVCLYEETNDIQERKGRGRRRIIQGQIRRQFRQLMSRYPTATSSSIANRLELRTGVRMSARTVRRTRRNENYHPVHVRTHWTINEAQAARRFQYARTHQMNNWMNTIFSNEKRFEVDESGTVFWVPIGAPCPQVSRNIALYK